MPTIDLPTLELSVLLVVLFGAILVAIATAVLWYRQRQSERRSDTEQRQRVLERLGPVDTLPVFVEGHTHANGAKPKPRAVRPIH